MPQITLNTSYMEKNGIYSVSLGDKIVDIDKETFLKLSASHDITYSEESYIEAYKNFDTSFYTVTADEW